MSDTQPPPTPDELHRNGLALLDAGDDEAGAALCLKAAIAGHSDAQYSIGTCYINGTGVPPIDTEGLAWLRRAADQEHPLAMCALGLFYSRLDEQQSFDWYRKAAELGFASAQYELGMLYLTGHSVPPDAHEACAWLRRAATQGDAAAATNLGVTLLGGAPEGHAEGVQWLYRAALTDFPAAMMALGNLYAEGRAVTRDEVAALTWMRQASRRGWTEARRRLDTLFTIGALANPRDERSIDELRSASQSGDADATWRLGVAYALGLDVDANETAAHHLLLRAAREGSPAACVAAALRLMRGEGAAESEASGLEWLQKAAEVSALGAFLLSECYLLGSGVARDDAAGLSWLQRAAAGSPHAAYRLGIMRAKGQGAPRDAEAALRLFENAAERGDVLALGQLVRCYAHGFGTPALPERAAAMAVRAAAYGLPTS